MKQPAIAYRKQLTLVACSCVVGAAFANCAPEDPGLMPAPTASVTPSDTSTVPSPGTTPGATGSSPSAAPTPTPTPTPMPTPTPSMTQAPPPPAPPRCATGAGPSFAATVAAAFDAKCTMTCHEPGGILGGLGGPDPCLTAMMDMTSAASYAQLTGPTSLSTQATSMWLVGMALADSYLWHKLQGTHETVMGCGATMPVGTALTDEEMAAVQAWIEGGACP